MVKITLRALSIALIITLVLSSVAFAELAWHAQYTPKSNSRVTVARIQDFLNKQEGSLKGAKMINGVMSCYGESGEVININRGASKLTPAEVFYLASQTYDMNVCFLLAIAQKETSLIERPASQDRMNYATGYKGAGWGLYRQVMATAKKYKGFGERGYSLDYSVKIYTPKMTATARRQWINGMYKRYCKSF